jgi:hypothetical protein
MCSAPSSLRCGAVHAVSRTVGGSRWCGCSASATACRARKESLEAVSNRADVMPASTAAGWTLIINASKERGSDKESRANKKDPAPTLKLPNAYNT